MSQESARDLEGGGAPAASALPARFEREDDDGGNKHDEEEERRIAATLPIRIVSRVVRGFGRGSKDLGIPTANLATSDEDAGGEGGEGTRIALSAGRKGDGGDHDGPAPTLDDLPTGIYWGFCRIGDAPREAGRRGEPSSAREGGNRSVSSGSGNGDGALGRTLRCAVSIGYNPTYGNDRKTIEPHLIAPSGDPRRHASSCQETLYSDFYGHPCRLSVAGYLRPELPFGGLDELTLAIKADIATAERLAGAAGDDPRLAAERDWVESDEPL
jgi:riboflavin kinase